MTESGRGHLAALRGGFGVRRGQAYEVKACGEEWHLRCLGGSSFKSGKGCSQKGIISG